MVLPGTLRGLDLYKPCDMKNLLFVLTLFFSFPLMAQTVPVNKVQPMLKINTKMTDTPTNVMFIDTSGNIAISPVQILLRPRIPVPVTRPLNTPFMIDSLRGTRVSYSVRSSCAVSVSGIQSGFIYLEASPTQAGTYSIINVSELSISGTVVVGLALTIANTQTVTGFIPAGYWVRLRTAGTGTNTYQSGQESLQ
jgi:hypothetical protein